ncbi:hypothetical protein GQ53DRAFT_339853 [Thozetella sp. PMI_491]|nr:hypothetical protein GQ53DRAFT_339853 [Thozetella sp. PMI_491]
MAPLILHNVPDDELYVGDDGVQRPYAMVFPQKDTAGRLRRPAPESGSFGKSSRRSRSRASTPARKEDPTLAAADKVFSNWFQDQSQSTGTSAPAQTLSQQNSQGADDGSPPPAQTRFVKKQEPTEVILRGFPSVEQQYAAINHYEQLAGRICEDYTREPPAGNRRYKSELRDPAFTRRKGLTPEERVKVNRADGGDHWVKVTFESFEAAEAATYASPQLIQGYLIFAEPYHGIPPSRDEAIPDPSMERIDDAPRSPTRRRHGNQGSVSRRGYVNPFGDNLELSPPQSQTSSRTLDSGTLSTRSDSATVSSGTVTGTSGARTTSSDAAQTTAGGATDSEFCKSINTVRKVRLLPAEQALLPQPSYTQRIVNQIPFLKWFSGSMIGNEVPRTDAGEFDWDRASLYWKFIYWLDLTFGLFGGEIMSADKDD